jgi:lipoprotein-releasing system permease protein
VAATSVQAEAPPVFVGSSLAHTLGITCGDKAQLIASSGTGGGRDMRAAFRQFTVKGIFEVGMYEYDASLAFITLREAQDFFHMNEGVTGLEIRLTDLSKTDDVEQEMEALFAYPFWIKNWREINQNFFSALELQKAVMFVVLTLIILVGAFNIISTLILTVMDKTKEIAVLKSMGAREKSIARIFMIQGLLLGGIGTVLGLLGGYGLASLAGSYPLVKLDPDIYYLSSLPVEMRMNEFLLVGCCAMLLCALATLYPARQAGRLDPAEVFRYG